MGHATRATTDSYPIEKTRRTNKMKILKLIKLMLVMTSLGVLSLLGNANAESVGTSTADAPNLVGQIKIYNPTQRPINYQMRWGNNVQWQQFTLQPGEEYRHWKTLDQNGRAPAPQVRFDGIRETKTYDSMRFGKAGYAGFGPRGYIDESIHYEFRYDASGQHLDLYEKG